MENVLNCNPPHPSLGFLVTQNASSFKAKPNKYQPITVNGKSLFHSVFSHEGFPPSLPPSQTLWYPLARLFLRPENVNVVITNYHAVLLQFCNTHPQGRPPTPSTRGLPMRSQLGKKKLCGALNTKSGFKILESRMTD